MNRKEIIGEKKRKNDERMIICENILMNCFFTAFYYFLKNYANCGIPTVRIAQ